MLLKIVEIHPAKSEKELNTEWFVLENGSDSAFSTKNCTVSVRRNNSKKRTELGMLDPGFTMAPGERVRVITGNPGRKAHGSAPKDDVKNYNLFLGSTVLKGKGTQLIFALRSHTLATAEFDPGQDSGVGTGE